MTQHNCCMSLVHLPSGGCRRLQLQALSCPMFFCVCTPQFAKHGTQRLYNAIAAPCRLGFDERAQFPTQVSQQVTPAVSSSTRLITWEPLAGPHSEAVRPCVVCGSAA